MKLRNKKTGEIGELSGVNRIIVYEPNMPVCGNSILGEYDTLAELNEDWKDYTPIEPIIGDPKIRKVVRVWAEANDVESVVIVSSGTLRCRQKGIDIEFNGSPFYGWTSAIKTITELCGEEEE